MTIFIYGRLRDHRYMTEIPKTFVFGGTHALHTTELQSERFYFCP